MRLFELDHVDPLHLATPSCCGFKDNPGDWRHQALPVCPGEDEHHKGLLKEQEPEEGVLLRGSRTVRERWVLYETQEVLAHLHHFRMFREEEVHLGEGLIESEQNGKGKLSRVVMGYGMIRVG